MKNPDLSVIILNFNTQDLLEACLLSLTKIPKSELSFEVIVVDNGSRDGSVQMVKQKFPSFLLVDNKKNLGFAAGNNKGVPHAKGRYVLFLNPDTIVPEGTLGYMVKFMDENPDAGISTCKVELYSGGLDMDSHRGFPTPWNALSYFSGLASIFPRSRFFNSYHLGHLDMSKTHEIESCVGAFLLIRPEIGKAVGWWDEDYFFYGEDIEFCYRVKELGFKIMYIPHVKIIHYKGASTGIRAESAKISKASPETKRMVARESVQAMKTFYKKHYLKKYPSILNWLVFRALDLKLQIRLRGFK